MYLKEKINTYLVNENINLLIMVDKLDDFVLKKDFEIQKRLITALINCENRYSEDPSIFLKIFIRDDLLERIDPYIEQTDKIDDRIVNLSWTPVEIRRFMARRLAHNYEKFLDLDLKSLIEDELEDELETDLLEVKDIHFKDRISKILISLVFPDTLVHLTEVKKQQDIKFCKLIETHFKLSKNTFSPRIMLRFLQLSFEKTLEYYLDNPGEKEKVVLNTSGEYPLIKRQCAFDAYKSITKKTVQWTLSKARKFSYDWAEILSNYFNTLNKYEQFKLDEFCRSFGCDLEKARIIMAFLENVGAIQCIRPNRLDWLESIYRTPLFYRAYSYHSEWGFE